VIAALVGAAALLLLAAGAAKLVDPTRTVGALAARGWAVAPVQVRVGAAAETVLAAAALAIGGRALSGLVAVSYVGFAVFVGGALRSGVPIGSCGCFGSADTVPRPVHVVVDVAFAVAAAAGAVVGLDPLVDAPIVAVVAAFAVAAGGYAVLTNGSGVSHRGIAR